ncbi:MAG: SUMF1/EgtB/PvdO family nonheme iron enzyme [Candidatus Accumulibacter sp.]|uniref:SUMF1/EgtB/PvdO family nonheme iron enzyme n=1 Tax=Candidatus Accumulibacter proximus TaxID=2954385 RepID=A0A935PZQ1_9PROT|nr:SUMF1/EgtB/PvdO family nonheme iron enzyme [Candidatus Accumulibacter proximus]
MERSSRRRPLRRALGGSPRHPVRRYRFPGGVPFLPCSVTLPSVPLVSVTPGAPTLEGVRGRLPPLRRAQRRVIFCYPCLAGWRHPVRRSGEVVRGGSWNNHRDNARCAYRNRNHPGNRNDNIGFRVVLRSSHVLQPLLLVPPRGGTVRRHIRAGRVPEMPVDPRQR